MVKRFFYAIFLSVFAVGLLLSPIIARATTITYSLHDPFITTDPTPVGTLTVMLSDDAEDGSVLFATQLTSTASSEFITSTWFNLNPLLFDLYVTPHLTFTPIIGGPPPDSINDIKEKKTPDNNDGVFESMAIEDNKFNPGDGQTVFFDFEVEFKPTEMVDNVLSMYTVTLDEGSLDIYSFIDLNAAYAVGAHIQGVGVTGEESAKIAPSSPSDTVPEPASMLLLGLCLIGMAVFVKKKEGEK